MSDSLVLNLVATFTTLLAVIWQLPVKLIYIRCITVLPQMLAV